MDVKGYIIPPPIETEQCIKILKKHGQPQRCGGQTSKEDLKQAKRLILELAGHTDHSSTIKRVILLRVCDNTHRKMLEGSEILGTLAQAYEKISLKTDKDKLLSAQRNEDVFELYTPTGRGETVRDILPQPINEKQEAWGAVYIFHWPRVPGFLKIGYAKLSAEKRVKKWRRCHPEAICLYKVEMAFPERMEKLIHAELAGKRYCLREPCSRCGQKHQEWFAVSFEESQRIIRGWQDIAASPLYTEAA